MFPRRRISPPATRVTLKKRWATPDSYMEGVWPMDGKYTMQGRAGTFFDAPPLTMFFLGDTKKNITIRAEIKKCSRSTWRRVSAIQKPDEHRII